MIPVGHAHQNHIAPSEDANLVDVNFLFLKNPLVLCTLQSPKDSRPQGVAGEVEGLHRGSISAVPVKMAEGDTSDHLLHGGEFVEAEGFAGAFELQQDFPRDMAILKKMLHCLWRGD